MDTSVSADTAQLISAFRELVADVGSAQQITLQADPAELAAASSAMADRLLASGWDELASADFGPDRAFIVTRLIEAAASTRPTPVYPFLEVWMARRALALAGTDPADLGDRQLVAGFGGWLTGESPSFPATGSPAAAIYLQGAPDGTVDLMCGELPGPGMSPLHTPDRTQHRYGLDTATAAPLKIGVLPRAVAVDLAAEHVLLEAAEMLGLATALLDATVSYTSQRVQFGRPIASFQSPRHRLVDQYVAVETLRSLTYYAAWASSADPANFAEYALTAKGYAAEHACAVADTSIQLHGAMGFSFETGLQFPVGRVYARALAAPSGEQCFAAVGGMLQDRGAMLTLAE
jgi:hypothetical protein